MRRYIGILILFSIALTGCNESGLGILSSVSEEVRYADHSIPNDISVSNLLVTSLAYYALAGRIYVADAQDVENGDGETQWIALETPSIGTAGADEVFLVSSAAALGDDIYAAVTSLDGTESSLFKLTTAGTAGALTYTWSTAIDTIDGDTTTTEFVTSVFPFGSNIGVCIESGSYEYEVYSSSDGTTFAAVTFPTTLVPPDKAITIGATTYLLAGNAVYENGSGSFALADDTVTVDTVTSPLAPGTVETDLADMYYLADLGVLFVAAPDGTIYIYDGTSWLEPVDGLFDFEDDDGNDYLPGNSIIRLSSAAITGGDVILLVGTDRGYCEFVLGTTFERTDLIDASDVFQVQLPGLSTNTVSTSGVDYTKVDLEISAILDIDTVGTALFVSTAGAGLWTTDYAVTDHTWNRE